MALNGNGRIGRWKKADVMFLVGLAIGVALIVYAAVIRNIAWAIVGLGAAGVPFTQRGDKG